MLYSIPCNISKIQLNVASMFELSQEEREIKKAVAGSILVTKHDAAYKYKD